MQRRRIAGAAGPHRFVGEIRRDAVTKTLTVLISLLASLLLAPCALAGRVVVAPDGSGDFTTIQAALSSITPSEANPYVVDVMPGRYQETVNLPSYVHLRGAGPKLTVLEGTQFFSVIRMQDLRDVTISGITVRGGFNGISVTRSRDVAIRDCGMTGNRRSGLHVYQSYGSVFGSTSHDNAGVGMYIHTSPFVLDSNDIRRNGGAGILLLGESPQSYEVLRSVTNNVIIGNNGDGIQISSDDVFVTNNRLYVNRRDGLGCYSSATVIAMGNHIAENDRYGVYATSYCRIRLTHNHLRENTRITATGPRADIFLDDANLSSDWTPVISFNVYDRLVGNAGAGGYNTNISGALLPNP